MAGRRGALPVQMMTTTEVAEVLAVHPNTVRLWADGGLIRGVRIGSRRDRRFSVNEVLRFLGENADTEGHPLPVTSRGATMGRGKHMVSLSRSPTGPPNRMAFDEHPLSPGILDTP